jgi:hypothetical protein
MTRRGWAPVALALALASTAASGAPMGSGVEAVAVLLPEADPEHDLAAKTLANALRQRVLDSTEFTLQGASVLPLVAMAHQAKCPLKGLHHPMREADENVFDAACLRRVGAEMSTRRFFWGLVYAKGGATLARLHFWDGDHDRAATLAYDAAQRERIADRLYKKLVTPNAVGDVKLAGAFGGELVVDGKPAGSYGDGVELTIETGEHFLEVREGPRVVARGRTRVEPGGRSEARLMPITSPAPEPPQPRPPFHEPPPVTVRPRASAWPWVIGGVGFAGFAGAGIFWGLRSSERSDLERVCDGRDCPPGQEGSTDRVNTYRTLAVASLGVGVAGTGLAAYLFARRRAPAPVSGALVPLAGGAAVGVVGRF